METVNITPDQKEILKHLMAKFINKNVTSTKLNHDEAEAERRDQQIIRKLYFEWK